MFTMILEGIKVAWMGVAGNKLRSLLTMLGIIIGVAAVIALVSAGEGATASVTSQIQGLGSNLVTINSTRPNQFRLELKDIAPLLARVQGINRLAPVVQSNNTFVKSATFSYQTSVQGSNEQFADVRQRTVERGRFLDADDVAQRARVAVIGTTTARQLYGNENPIGAPLRIRGDTYNVIGVFASKGQTFGQDNDDLVVVPITTLQRSLGFTFVNSFVAEARSADDALGVVAQVQNFYLQKHRTPDTVRVQSQDQILDTIKSTTRVLTLFLGAIAGISLLVGGIGIMNIMLVSVTERTREIGIRKAVGAKRRDIMLQFLVESVILSVAGGIVGILVGGGGSSLIGRALSLTTTVSINSVAVSFAFAVAVGIFFGLYPAVRASNLDPIEALRRE